MAKKNQKTYWTQSDYLKERKKRVKGATAEYKPEEPVSRDEILDLYKVRRQRETGTSDGLRDRISFDKSGVGTMNNRPTVGTSETVRTNPTQPLTVSRDLVDRVARNADNSRAELDRKAARIWSGDLQREQLLKDLDDKANAEEAKRQDLQRQAQAERTRRGINQNEISAAALEQIKKMRNGDGATLSGTVPEYTPVQQDEYRNTKEYQWARKHPEAAMAVSVFTNPITGIEGLANTARQFVDPNKMDPNQLKGAMFQNALRQGITRGKKDEFAKASLGRRIGFEDDGRESFAENASDFLVNTAIDAVNSTAGNLMLGPVNIAAMSGNAAQSKLYDALRDKDASRNQALATSTAFGIAEALFEKVSFENLMKWNLNPKTFEDFAKNVVRSVVAEGSEEVNTDIANDISDIFINRDNSEPGRIYNDYLLRGANPRQAFLYTLRDRIANNYSLSFLGGGLSGGFSAAGGAMYGAYQNRQQQRYDDALGAYKRARTNAYLDQGQSLGQALAEADINVWDDATKAGVGFYLDKGEETNGNFVFEPDNNRNIVSDDTVQAVEETSTVQKDTEDIVNAAVDELKRQQQEETDTSESTPDEAKAQTETMINALNEQQAETENAEIDDISPENAENLQNDTLNAENRTQEESEPDTGMSRTDVSRENDAETEITGNRIDGPVSSDTLREGLSRYSDFTADKVDYRIESQYNKDTGDYMYRAHMRDASNDIMGGVIVDGRAMQYTSDFFPTREEAVDHIVKVAKNNYFTSDSNTENTNDQLPEMESNGNTANDTLSGGTEVMSTGDVDRELDRRAGIRFPGDDDVKKAYKTLFKDYHDKIGSDIDPMYIITSYDDNVAKAYEAGLKGEPLSSLDNDKSFTSFDNQFHDIVDFIYRLGFDKGGNDNGSSSETGGIHDAGTGTGDTEQSVLGGTGRQHGEVRSEEMESLGNDRDSLPEASEHGETDGTEVQSGTETGVPGLRSGGVSEGTKVRDNESGSDEEGNGTADRTDAGRSGGTGGAGSTESGIPADEGNNELQTGRDGLETGRTDGRRDAEETGREGEEHVVAPLEPETPTEEAEQKKDLGMKQKPSGDNFYLKPDFDYPKTPAARRNANIDAIKTIKNILEEDRQATAEEQELLAKYTGWGGIGESEWQKAEPVLKDLLTEQELNDAKSSINTAFYTEPDIIRAIYKGLEHIGFNGGRVLEPSAGVGRFLGCMPENMLPSIKRMTAIELDTISGNVAKFLYPNWDVRVQGFEKANVINDFMDLAIGNIPFGDFGIVDKRYPKKVTKYIHNYFFARAIDSVRPGGVVCFITSTGTMDQKNMDFRQYLHERAELLGAIRLPDTAFKGTGTAVMSDILVFRKRESGKPYSGEEFARGATGWVRGEGNHRTNEYFEKHPDMMLGEITYGQNQYGKWGNILKYNEETPLSEQIEKAFNKITRKMSYPATDTVKDTSSTRTEARNNKEGTAYLKDGELYKNVDGEEVKVDITGKDLEEWAKSTLKESEQTPEKIKAKAEKEAKQQMEIYKSSMEIRDTARALQDAMKEGRPEKEKKALRKKLNTLYDNFINKYKEGFHQAAVRRTLLNDTDYFFLQSLEKLRKVKKGVGKNGQDLFNTFTEKSDIFYKDTLGVKKEVTHVDTVPEGVEASLAKHGFVDTKYIAQLMMKDESEIKKELESSDLVFKDENGNFVDRTTYLSGNVRAKLRTAEMMYESDKSYKRNVEELKKIQPTWIYGEDIKAKLGATWIPEDYFARFAEYLMGADENNTYLNDSIRVIRRKGYGYDVNYTYNNYESLFNSAKNTTTWGTKDMHLLYESQYDPGILYNLMNNNIIEVRKSVKDENGKSHSVLDEEATEAAKQMAEKVQQEFDRWLWLDKERKETLEGIFNDTLNNFVEPRYGSEVSLPGKSEKISLRDHQARAINRIIFSPYNTLLQHGVGAGKTFAAIGAGIKMKQLGLVSKPCYVVPKGKVPDWANDFYALKPDAKMLVATDETFQKSNRKQFMNLIATNDFDAIIMSYEMFSKVPVTPDYEKEWCENKLAELRAALEEDKYNDLKSGKKGRTQSQIERMIKKYEEKIMMLSGMARDENNIYFEQIGIDHIFLDEAQNYKNLMYYTNLKKVKDMGDAEGSERSYDMKVKADYLRGLNGKGLTFLTATPIMNSPVEAYNMLSYLSEDDLKAKGIYSLDDFIQAFGNIETIPRLDAAGRDWVMEPTFNGFTNLRGWSQLWHTIVDRVKTSDVPTVKLPKMKGGERKTIKCKAGDYARQVINGLADRLKNKSMEKGSENHIFRIQWDGKKASFSQRVLDPSLPYGAEEKVPKAVNEIFRIWQESKEFKGTDGETYHNGTQLVFCDYGVPTSKKNKKGKDNSNEGDQNNPNDSVYVEGLNVYQDMKDMLVAKGVPAEEIAFIQNYKDQKLEQLYEDVRNGKVRVLIGSTKVMGEGLNVQDRIVAIHEMNPVMRPGDVEQLEGRGIRQHNLSPEVEILVYVTEDTFDTKQWENIRTKADYIDKIQDGVIDGKEIEYRTSDFGSSASDIMALAAGDPRLKEQSEVNDELRKVQMRKSQFDKKVNDARDKIRELTSDKQKYTTLKANLEKDIASIKDITGNKFTAKVAGKTYDNREEFGKAVNALAQKALKDGDGTPRKIGTIAGLDLYVIGTMPQPTVMVKGLTSQSNFINIDNASGTEKRISNLIANFSKDLNTVERKLDSIEKNLPEYEKTSKETFKELDKLQELEKKSKDLAEDIQKNPVHINEGTSENVKKDTDSDVQYAKNKKKKAESAAEPKTQESPEGPRGDFDIEKRPQKKPTRREEEQKKGAQAFQESLRPDKFETEKNIGSDAELQRVDDILGEAAHDFGFQYTPGKRYVRGKDIGGQFNLRNKGIRTKVADDLPTFAHEFGHWLMDKYKVNDETIPDEIKDDIKKAYLAEYDEDDYDDSKMLSEGLAEFVRHYLTNRDTARIDYPKLARFINNKFFTSDLRRFEALADDINAVLAAGANEITQHTVQHEESLRDYREFGKKVHDAMVNAQINWVDSNYGMKDFDYEYGTNTHMRATNAEYIDGTIGYAMDGQLRDLEGRYLGKSLKDCVKGVNLDPKSQEFRDFGDYLVVRHAPERLALGMRTYADDRQNNQKWMKARQEELEKKYPHFAEVAKNLDKFQKNVLKHYALKYGLITPEAYKNMLKDYPHYVPFFRTGFKEKGNALRRAHGSGRTIINPLDNIITSTMKIMNAASRNAVLLEMRKAALMNDANALFLEQIPDPQVPQTFDMRGIKEALHNRIADIDVARGVDPTAQDLLHDMVDKIDNTLTQFQTGRARKDLNEIAIMVDGKPEFWKVNDENLFKSLTSMDYRTSNTLVQLYGKLTRFMTSNTTGNNVVWSIFSNSPRDFQTLVNYSDDKNILKLAKLIGDSYIQSFNEFRGEPTSDYYSEFLSMGAKGAPVWAGSETYVKDMRKLINSKKGFNPANLNPFKYFRFLAETIEMGPRYATYRLMREKGMSPQQAFYGSMDITTNFRKKGIVGKELNKAVQFFNANVQGLDHAVRYYSAEDMKGKANRNKAIKARMTFLVATSLITAMLSYAWNHRDKDDKDQYNLLSNYIKNYYFTFHLGDGKFFSIPKNHELSVLESFFERVFERLADDNDQAFNEYFDYFAEQVMPPIASEILEFPVHAVKDGLQPAIDDLEMGVFSNAGVLGVAAQAHANKDYRGAKIVPQAYENLAPKQQYNKKTSELAYLIGQALNISPMKLDHFAGNVLGYLWDYQSALLPIRAGEVKGERDPFLGVTKKYIRDNRTSNNVSNWIYDKADKSKERYETTGDNVLEYALDEYMKSRYNTYNKLSKNEAETETSRAERFDVLMDLRSYQKGGIDKDNALVYDLVEETGDKNFVPSVLDSTYKNGNGGEEISLSSSEFLQAQEMYEDLYYKYMSESIDLSESQDKWEYTRDKAKTEARNAALDEIIRQRGIESNIKTKASVGSFDEYVDEAYRKKKK